MTTLRANPHEMMQMEEPGVLSEWAKLIGATGVGGMLMALFVRMTFRKMTEEGTATQRAAGEADIIGQLRSEVDRLAGINAALSLKLAELQIEIGQLRGENAQLRIEVQSLSHKHEAGHASE